MMWYSGHSWGSCGLIVNVPAMVLFWAVVFTTLVLAAHLLRRERTNSSAMTVGGPTRAKGVAAQPVRTETDNDEFHCRLM